MQNHTYPNPQHSPLFHHDLAEARRGSRPVAVERRTSASAVAGVASVGLAAGFVAGFLIGWRSAAEWL